MDNAVIEAQQKEKRKNRILAIFSMVSILISILSYFSFGQSGILGIIMAVIPFDIGGFLLGAYVVYKSVIKKTGGDDKLLKYVFLSALIIFALCATVVFYMVVRALSQFAQGSLM